MPVLSQDSCVLINLIRSLAAQRPEVVCVINDSTPSDWLNRYAGTVEPDLVE